MVNHGQINWWHHFLFNPLGDQNPPIEYLLTPEPTNRKSSYFFSFSCASVREQRQEIWKKVILKHQMYKFSKEMQKNVIQDWEGHGKKSQALLKGKAF